jgi:hypothetical protein
LSSQISVILDECENYVVKNYYIILKDLEKNFQALIFFSLQRPISLEIINISWSGYKHQYFFKTTDLEPGIWRHET